MNERFERALVNDSCLDTVRIELRKAAESDCGRILRKIEADYTTATLIREALRMSPQSPAYKVAEGFMEEYRKKHTKAESDENPVTADLINFLHEMEQQEEEMKKGEQDHGTGK